MPEISANVTFGSDLYSALLKKITDQNHSVVFALSIDNVKLLRMCECFIAGLYCANNERIASIPHIIGRAQIPPGIFVPVWSASEPLDGQDLPGVLTKAFSKIFKEKRYSEEGFALLLKLLTDKIPEITGGSKLRIYKPSMRHSRLDIEGSHKMLDTGDIVRKIESIASDIQELLKPYELIFPPNISLRYLHPAPRSADAAFEQIIPLIFEYSSNSMSEQEVETFCADAYGTVLTLTPEAIELRSRRFGKKNRMDNLGNIYSFLYKVYDAPDSGSIIVCPENKDDLVSEFFGVSANPSVAASANEKDVTSKDIKEFFTIEILEVKTNGDVKAKVKTNEPGQDYSRNIASNKLLMFLILQYYSILGEGIGYLSKKIRTVNKKDPLVGYDKKEKATPLCQEIYPISDKSEYSQYFSRLVSKVLTGKVISKDNKLLEQVWLTTHNKSNLSNGGEANYSRGKLHSVRLLISVENIARLKQTASGKLLPKTDWKKLDTLVTPEQ